MKRAKAIHAFDHLAEACAELAGGAMTALRELWAHGPVLDGDPGEVPEAVLVLDVPADTLAWRVTPAAADPLLREAAERRLPLALLWRSVGRPVANHHVVRPLLLWSAHRGRDERAFEALRHPPVPDALRLAPPDPEALADQLTSELAVSREHLESAVAGYWDPGWRRDHRAERRYPEHHLWEASCGYLELMRALDKLSDR